MEPEIGTMDTETDPFLYGRKPEVFTIGLFYAHRFYSWWGKDCKKRFIKWIEKHVDKGAIIYVHNGGRFDFLFFLDWLENPVKLINGRIVECKIMGVTFRDSYAIIPIPLSAYKKDEIDYGRMEAGEREKHKDEILSYLKGDCVYLHEMVSAFYKNFGDKLTIGGAAIKLISEMHPFQKGNAEHDAKFRPFYFGGRVECFRGGKIEGTFKVFDVNSMYPHVMKNCTHPTGSRYIELDAPKMRGAEIVGFEGAFYFLEVECENHGALPSRTKAGLDFNIRHNIFLTTSHEYRIAVKYGRIKKARPIRALLPMGNIRFGRYVDTYYAQKVACKKSGDKIGETFAKLLLNSAYGKYGQNPANYFDWQILPSGQFPDGSDLWEPYEAHESITIWRKPITRHSYYDVAIAASITSAARAVLLDAICNTTRPLYCDTDSLICENLSSRIDPHTLGAWKFEGDLDTVYIAGKKLYAGFHQGECIKLASKGVKATPQDIIDLCGGQEVTFKKDAPNLKLNGDAKFLSRKLRKRV